jgi:F-type H+-transporting ATPase subunit epsilon
MTFNLHVMVLGRTVWNSEVQEIILPTVSGQIGILPNHMPLLTALETDIMKVRVGNQWTTLALMGGSAKIGTNQVTVLVSDAEKASDIDPIEAQNRFEETQLVLNQAVGPKQIIEANLALTRAKARLKASKANLV